MKRLILNLGTSCFVRCVGCYNQFANSLVTHRPVTGDAVRALLEEAWGQGLRQVTFGGGDPLSRPDLEVLLAYAKGLGYMVKLDTVGTTFAREANTIFFGRMELPRFDVRQLAGLIDEIGLPLDGSTSEIMTRFRTGRPNIAEEIAEAAALVRNAGLSLSVNTVVHRGNVLDLPAIQTRVGAFQASRWQIFQFMPIGPIGFAAQETLSISADEFSAAVRDIPDVLPGSAAEVSIKSVANRRDTYVIVDDAGIAWLPTDSADRTVVGHIDSELAQVLDALHG